MMQPNAIQPKRKMSHPWIATNSNQPGAQTSNKNIPSHGSNIS